ncbi:MAG: Gfo/Idh/MocA family oxidoreductase [Planctomycetota bacterium]|nr:Gfo/Idh/MocA family oxidoreductase [Planctomycetota bacterium]
MPPFRVAIAGCHRQVHRKPGSHNWASAFDAVAETEIAAVFDLGAETRQQFVECWGQVPCFEDYQRMLNEVEPDIICIATRQTMHANQIELAVAAGVKGILSDKPLATSLEEADRIFNVLEEGNVPLAFGLDRRWWSPYRHLQSLIEDGAIGKPAGGTAYALPNLVNHGCHWFDTLMMLLGDPEPVWVSAMVDDNSTEPAESTRRLDPAGRGQVGFSDGVVTYITPNSGTGRGPGFDIIGDKGRLISIEDAGHVYLWPASDSGPSREMKILSMPVSEPGWPAGPTAVNDLVQAVRNKSLTACDRHHAHRATEISFAFHESSSFGGAKVLLPLVNRERRIESLPWGNE